MTDLIDAEQPPRTAHAHERREIVLEQDRTRSIRKARRHSALVRVMRVLLPISAIAIFVYYGAAVLEIAGWSNPVARLPVPKVLPENLAMNNPRYRGFTKDGGSYLIEARTARQDFKTPGVVRMEKVSGDMTRADKSVTRLTANQGVFNSRREEASLTGNIRINSDDGSWARLLAASIYPKDGRIVSKTPVAVGNNAGIIRAKGMTIRQKTREVTFSGDVRARLTPSEGAVVGDIDRDGNVVVKPGKPRKPAAAATPATDAEQAAKAGGGAIGRLFQGGGNGPIDITAERLDIDDEKRTATFSGKVVVRRGAATLSAPELRIAYDGAPSGGLTGAAAKPASGSAESAKAAIKTIVAAGPVLITEGADTRVTGQTALFDAATSRATLDGGVVINRAPDTRVTAEIAAFDTARDVASLDGSVLMIAGKDRRATGDHAEFHNVEQTALLTGAVVLLQGQNVLKGRRLAMDQKAGRSQLTATAGDGGNGRISAQFVQSAAKGGKAKAKPADDAAPAAGGIAGGLLSTSSFRTDPNAPIAVAAERLDVDDKAGQAVFRGDVVARQGDVDIRSAELHARYSGSAGLATSPLDGENGADRKPDAPAAQLTHIQAKGSVVVTSKGGQKATGDWADFETAANTVTLGGDVVLTQGRNVVRGTRLVIDLTSGEAVLKSDNAAAPEVAAEKPGGGWKATRQPSRPSAVFFPQDAREAQQHAKPGNASTPAVAQPAPAADGWSSTTQSGARPAADN
jgi:LPS export ABC transporter protein LptC/lipopolysaccharide transport protein LptA